MRLLSLRRHLTTPNVVAVVALVIALGTGAYAAGLAKNSVKSKQIKDGAVSSKELKADAVTGAKVAAGSLTGADFADDSLNGVQIAEDTLQGVNAVSADTVGSDLQLKKVNFQVPQNVAPATVLVFPGLFRIDAQCASFGDGLDINAFTGVDDSEISLAGWFASSGNEEDALRSINSNRDFDFDVSETFSIDNNLPNNLGVQHVTVQFATPAGFVMTAQLRTEEVGASCKITGNAIGG
jgi:hypothetical protein